MIAEINKWLQMWLKMFYQSLSFASKKNLFIWKVFIMKFIVVWRVVLLSISFQVALIPFVANHVLVPVFVLVLSRSSSIYLLMIYINHKNKYHLARPYSIGCLHNNQFLLYCLFINLVVYGIFMSATW